MEGSVKFSTWMRRLSPFSWYVCVVEHCHVQEGHYRLTIWVSFIGFLLWASSVSLYALEFIFSPLGKKSTRKNNQQNFTRQGFMLSFEGRILLLRETMTMFGSRDAIHRGPASFLCMIHVPVLVIIPVVRKRYNFLTFTGISFCNLITWPIPVQIGSNFKNICGNNLESND